MMRRTKTYFEKCLSGIVPFLGHDYNTTVKDNRKENTYVHRKIQRNYKGNFGKI